LVLKVEGDGIGLEQFGFGTEVAEEHALPPEADVLDSELDCPGAGARAWHGIFTYSQKEEECHADEVRDGSVSR
jgi:hypothetical protein